MNYSLALVFCVVAVIVCTLPSTEGGCYGWNRRFDPILKLCVYRCRRLGSHCKSCNVHRQCLRCEPPFHLDANRKCIKRAAPALPALPASPAPPAPTQGPPPQTEGPPAQTQGPNQPTAAETTVASGTTTPSTTVNCNILATSFSDNINTSLCSSGQPVIGQTGFIQLNSVKVLTTDWCTFNASGSAGVTIVMNVDPVACTSLGVNFYMTGQYESNSTAFADQLTSAPTGTLLVVITAGPAWHAIGPAISAMGTVCNNDISDYGPLPDHPLPDTGSLAFVCETGFLYHTRGGSSRSNESAFHQIVTGTVGDALTFTAVYDY